MTLSVLSTVPQTPDEWSVWNFAHQAHHRDLNQAYFNTFGSVLPEFVLDPVSPDNLVSYGYQHQSMHDALDAALGITGADMKSLDWNDSAAVADFVQNNFTLHYQEGQALGVQ